MKKIDGIKEIIIDAFIAYYKADELENACKRYGLNVEKKFSKRETVKTGLEKLTDQEIEKTAIQIEKDFNDSGLIKKLSVYFNDANLEFSFASRNAIVAFIEQEQNMEGKVKLEKFIERFLFDNELMHSFSDLFDDEPSKEEFIQYYMKDKKINYGDLLTNGLEIKYFPDSKFIEFLEYLVSNEVRTNREQVRYVQAINDIIKNDGYELALVSSTEIFNYYKIRKQSCVLGNFKNLIFAPYGNFKKLDIVVENVISNEVRLADNANKCLVYNLKPNADGLKLNDLIEWWRVTANIPQDQDAEKNLYIRLKKSLESKAEEVFFYTYFYHYRRKEKKDIPALIPQVQLHYDPKTLEQRNGNALYNRQRMDFLMLLPGRRNIIFEIDGKEHYSKEEKPCPKLYSEMVRSDRQLKLKGYDVYRFGGYELMLENAQKMISTFFDNFFERYNILF